MGYPVLMVSDDSLQQIETSIETVGARINRSRKRISWSRTFRRRSPQSKIAWQT